RTAPAPSPVATRPFGTRRGTVPGHVPQGRGRTVTFGHGVRAESVAFRPRLASTDEGDRLDIGQLGNERVPEDAAVLGQGEAIAGREEQDVGIVLVDCHSEAGRPSDATFTP